MTATVTETPNGVIVTITCSICGAKVVHADSVTLQLASAYLSAVGWEIHGDPAAEPQTFLCPRCVIVGGDS